MNIDMRRAVRSALTALACATLLTACAAYEHEPYPAAASPAPIVTSSRPAVVVPAPVPTFDRLDSNRDGFLSRGEIEPLGIRSQVEGRPTGYPSFEALDIDRDGFLSRAEAEPMMSTARWVDGRWVLAMPAPPAFSFEALDVDRDGFLTRAEAAPAISSLTFERFDANRDGFLSRGEAELMMRSSVGATYGPQPLIIHGPR